LFANVFDLSNRERTRAQCWSHLVPAVVQDGPTVHTLRRPHVTFRSLFPQLGGTIEASYLLLRRGTFPTCKRQVSGSIPLTGSRTRVYLDGREYGWFAWPEQAEAAARELREAGHDAVTGMVSICKKLTPEEQRQIEIDAGMYRRRAGTRFPRPVPVRPQPGKGVLAAAAGHARQRTGRPQLTKPLPGCAATAAGSHTSAQRPLGCPLRQFPGHVLAQPLPGASLL